MKSAFLDLFKAIPTPVTILTTASSPGTYRGCTCSSFTSVSLNPPIISFALRTPSTIASHLFKPFAINVLSTSQVPLSVHFSTPTTQSDFSSINNKLIDGVPILLDGVGSIVCELWGSKGVGDHDVFYGKVKQTIKHTANDALVYYQRGYRNVGDELFIKSFEEGLLSADEWGHKAHIRMAWNYIREIKDIDEAITVIRNGIIKYNSQNPSAKPYNETITRFFIHLIDLCLRNDYDNQLDFEVFIAKYKWLLMDKKLILNYYSSGRIKEGANEFMRPDRRNGLPESLFDV